MNSLFKYLSLLMTVLFIAAAYVQWNDPDATTWYFVYGIAALASILYYLGRLNFIVALVLGILYIIGCVMLWPEKWEGLSIGDGDIDNIERARESLGLLITALVMFFYAIRIRLGK